MKKVLLLLLALPLLFSSCEKDDNVTPEVKITGHYVLNYGSYSSSVGSLSFIDLEESTVDNGVYKSVNGVAMSGKPQYAYEYNGNVYFMGNAIDEIFHVDSKTIKQSKNGVSKDIVKPRFCVGQGDYLYISCWGGDVWGDTSLGYIAKYNVTTDEVEAKIAMPGGPEGLAIVNGTLFCALNYASKIGMVDLANDETSFIDGLVGVTSYFVKDKFDNLYVTMPNTYSSPNPQAGIGYINTSTKMLEASYELSSISSNYASVMALNKDESKLYVMGGSWDAGYTKYSGGIFTFDTASKAFETEPLITGVDGMKGMHYNAQSNLVYVMISESTTANGLLQMYNTDGEMQSEYKTGISPTWIVDIK